ncbi:MAG: enoyl-CoA hydratase/isomerase family protein [Janthinobacterium lividum]
MNTPASSAADPVAVSEVLFEVIHHVGVITLNRPKALNALTMEMTEQIAARLAAWRDDTAVRGVLLRGAGERAFCAGGDIRALHAARAAGLGWQQFFVDEYRLDHTIHRYPKPVLVFMDGVTMGGGMGLAQGAHLRIVTERSKIAMPETRIGIIPDVGASYFLSRLAGGLPYYLGLVGVTLTGEEAVLCGLADVLVDAETLAGEHAYRDALARIDWREPDVLTALSDALAPRRQRIEAKSMKPLLGAIHVDFASTQTLQGILTALQMRAQAGGDPAQEWARQTLRALAGHSPLALSLTYRALRQGRRLDLAACFRQELRVISRAVETGDFAEGVRALLVDKDQQPIWKYGSLEEIDERVVDEFFKDFHDGDPLADLDAASQAG